MLRFYNTLSRRKETFVPLQPGHVKLYTCGPSVYMAPHIGNFKTYIFEDILRRWLAYRGYRVRHVMNLTDVEIKSIWPAHGSLKRLLAITGRNARAFFSDAKTLRLLRPAIVAPASKHVPDMVRLIAKLMKRKYAYVWPGDNNVYYDISRFRNYGRLSRTPRSKFAKLERRISKDDYWQYEMGDFVLWRAKSSHARGNVWWNSPWGPGRPGWNIECSAMALKYLGPTLDIHAGGSDLVFSHHENEIAQSEGATGRKFVRYWMHCRHLLIEEQKMSKSLRNFYTLPQLVRRGYSPRAIRYLLLSRHYRERLNFTFAKARQYERDIARLEKCCALLRNYTGGMENGKVREMAAAALRAFEAAMDDDLNVPKALSAFLHMMTKVHALVERKAMSREEAEAALAAAEKMNGVLVLV
ncbi:Cysteine--tRNA ligase [Candidatus Burarchaeum australiense]|nr:Cysteine--tRNA ligase [Candidatus Burarchaeum australiense]